MHKSTFTKVLSLFALAGAATYGTYKLNQYFVNKHFENKTDEEINEMIESAFEKIKAYVDIAKDGSELLKKAFDNLKYGYFRVSLDNIDFDALQKLLSLVDNVNKVANNATQIKEPIEIIDTSIKLKMIEVQGGDVE